MKTQFDALKKLLDETAKAKEATKRTIAELEASRKDYSDDYNREFITPRIAKAKTTLQASMNASLEKVLQYIGELSTLASEKANQPLDLGDARLGNALRIIELAGDKLSHAQARQINAAFVGNRPALDILKTAYQAKGVKSDGDMQNMVYSHEVMARNLTEKAYNALGGGQASLNSLGREISKYATLEGLDFQGEIEPGGDVFAMRKAAGLAVTDL